MSEVCVVAVAADVLYYYYFKKKKKKAGPCTHMWSSMEAAVVPLSDA